MNMEITTLQTGDYSLHNYAHKICIERKSIADLVGSFSHGRKRFEKELERMVGFEIKEVVIEGHRSEIENHEYKGEMNPHALMQSIRAWHGRGITFNFLGDRKGVTDHVRETLLFYAKDRLSEGFPFFQSQLED